VPFRRCIRSILFFPFLFSPLFLFYFSSCGGYALNVPVVWAFLYVEYYCAVSDPFGVLAVVDVVWVF